MLKKGRRRRQDHPRTQSKTKRQSHPDEKKKRQNHPDNKRQNHPEQNKATKPPKRKKKKATRPPRAKQSDKATQKKKKNDKTTQNQRHLLTRPACLHLISPANLTWPIITLTRTPGTGTARVPLFPRHTPEAPHGSTTASGGLQPLLKFEPTGSACHRGKKWSQSRRLGYFCVR